MKGFRWAPIVLGLAVVLGSAGARPQDAAYVPEWQAKAGGHQEFDVASVRENKESITGTVVNVPIGPEDAFLDTGGVFTARNIPLVTLIAFAYKNTTGQREAFRASLPEWALTT